MRILVAEDERVTRASLVRQLQAWGHEVVPCEDGAQAWERFSEGGFDVVLTDWDMPQLSGPELISKIRSAGSSRFVYAVMLTGRSDKSDLIAGIEAGADDFVSKPFDPGELRVRLLAGERIVRLEQALSRQNAELREAGERMRHDLHAAARVQRALLPGPRTSAHGARAAWGYTPTDELAGDGIGLHVVDDRYLVGYVLDVSGHGVPAALLAVTAMHALAPTPETTSLLRDASSAGPTGTVRRPAEVAAEMNRRFKPEESDNRFLTMALCTLDARCGLLHFTTAGHPPPILLRAGSSVELPAAGGLPIAVTGEATYEDASVQLRPGDRVCLVSDGLIEQFDKGDAAQFGLKRLTSLLCGLHSLPIEQAVTETFGALADWAGRPSFADDASLVLIDWTGE